MIIRISCTGKNTDPQIAAMIYRAAASLGLQGQVKVEGTGTAGRERTTGSEKHIVFADLRDPEIVRYRLARAAGISTILFVCTGNAIRSQIAEALVNHLFQGKWAAFSAGALPMAIPADVSCVMTESGIDTAAHCSKHIDVFSGCVFDRVVILSSDAERFCPNLPKGARRDHMIFDDPLSSSLLSEGIVFSLKSTLRSLRDEMKRKLGSYLTQK